MPFCPRCEQEYEAGFANCADCDVPLVPSRAAALAAKAAAKSAPSAAAIAEEDIRPEFPEVPFYCPDEKLAAAFEAALAAEQIPTFRYEAPVVVDGTTQHRIAVPPEFANFAVRVASARLGQAVVRLGGGVLLAGPAEEMQAARKSVGEDALSRVRAAEQRGDAGVDELAAVIASSTTPGPVELAAAALARLDTERSRAAALAAVRAAIAAKDDEKAQALLTGLAPGSPWTLPREVADLITTSPDPLVRALAADAAGALQCEESVGALVGALADKEASVREAAIDALFLLTGERMGFDAGAPESERAAALATWRGFLAGR